MDLVLESTPLVIIMDIKKIFQLFLLLIFLTGCGFYKYSEYYERAYGIPRGQQLREAEIYLKSYIGKTKEEILREFGRPRDITTGLEKVPYFRKIGVDEIWTYWPRGKLIGYEFFFKDGIVVKAEPI